MATIRKVRRRWQAIIRRKVHISKTFWKKSDARFWADKTKHRLVYILNFNKHTSKI